MTHTERNANASANAMPTRDQKLEAIAREQQQPADHPFLAANVSETTGNPFLDEQLAALWQAIGTLWQAVGRAK